MSQHQKNAAFQPFFLAPEPGKVEGGMGALVYRSRATEPLSYLDLQQLALDSQTRNRREGVTGLIVYDEAHFYQWLEGPIETVNRLMGTIHKDPRHCDIEIISVKSIAVRRFRDWDMKLATRMPQSELWRHDVLYPRQDVVRELRRNEQAVPSILAALAPSVQPLDANEPQSTARNEPTSALIHNFVTRAIIPELVGLHDKRLPKAQMNTLVIQLADMLLSSEADAAINFIHEYLTDSNAILPIFETLIEPAARRLGDLWLADVCSEYDVTIGLCRLQAAVRLLGSESLPAIIGDAITPSVLVIPQPGEMHALTSAMDSEAMWQAGWSPQYEIPNDDLQMKKLLAANWFDVLDLSMSAAVRREHWLPRMTETVELARAASRNPSIVIMVGGRIFSEPGTDQAAVKADGASRSAAHITDEILRTLAPHKDVPPVRVLSAPTIFTSVTVPPIWQR